MFHQNVWYVQILKAFYQSNYKFLPATENVLKKPKFTSEMFFKKSQKVLEAKTKKSLNPFCQNKRQNPKLNKIFTL